jgi:HK97 family phage major capsid protein
MNELNDVVTRLADLEGIIRNEPAPHNAGGTLAPDDQHSTAFRSYMLRGIKAGAMQEDVGSEGGFLVPDVHDNALIAPLSERSVARRIGARIMQVGEGGAHLIPTITDSGAAALTYEENEYDVDAPSLGQVELRPYKFTRLTKVSEELLDDSRIDVISEVVMPDASRAFAKAENTYFLNGTGAGQPQGIAFGASENVVTSSSATTIDYDDIVDTLYELPLQYRDQARWIVSDDAAKALRKLKDGAGRPLWEVSMQAGQPDLLLGRPVATTSYLPQVATGNTPVILGDMSYFWIIEFAGVAVQRLDELYAATGQIGFRWYRRMDSKVMLKEAFASLKMK